MNDSNNRIKQQTLALQPVNKIHHDWKEQVYPNDKEFANR
jgi:hypothetical protein